MVGENGIHTGFLPEIYDEILIKFPSNPKAFSSYHREMNLADEKEKKHKKEQIFSGKCFK